MPLYESSCTLVQYRTVVVWQQYTDRFFGPIHLLHEFTEIGVSLFASFYSFSTNGFPKQIVCLRWKATINQIPHTKNILQAENNQIWLFWPKCQFETTSVYWGPSPALCPCIHVVHEPRVQCTRTFGRTWIHGRRIWMGSPYIKRVDLIFISISRARCIGPKNRSKLVLPRLVQYREQMRGCFDWMKWWR